MDFGSDSPYRPMLMLTWRVWLELLYKRWSFSADQTTIQLLLLPILLLPSKSKLCVSSTDVVQRNGFYSSSSSSEIATFSLCLPFLSILSEVSVSLESKGEQTARERGIKIESEKWLRMTFEWWSIRSSDQLIFKFFPPFWSKWIISLRLLSNLKFNNLFMMNLLRFQVDKRNRF